MTKEFKGKSVSHVQQLPHLRLEFATPLLILHTLVGTKLLWMLLPSEETLQLDSPSRHKLAGDARELGSEFLSEFPVHVASVVVHLVAAIAQHKYGKRDGCRA